MTGSQSDNPEADGLENGVKPSSAFEETPFKREELVRLLIQSMRGLGYPVAARQLEQEAGIALEAPAVSEFRAAVLTGAWERVTALLPALGIRPDETPEVRFAVGEQRFLERLEAGESEAALAILRGELAALGGPPDRLHRLASLLLFAAPAELRRRADWDGAAGGSRRRLLRAIQQHISPTLMIAENRLQELLRQAVEWQRGQCAFHTREEESASLLRDHRCAPHAAPTRALAVLAHHSDEVWFVAFSPSGRLLASASKDHTVAIWATDSLLQPAPAPMLVLEGHTQPLSMVAWSPDERHLLSCGADRLVKLWRLPGGECVRTLARHRDAVTGCAWLPDGRRFVTGALDRRVLLSDIDGGELHEWTGARVNDLAVSADGRWAVAASSSAERKLRVYDLQTLEELESIQESDPISCIAMAPGEPLLLVSVAAAEPAIHLWDLAERRLLLKFRGHKASLYVVRPNFGGLNNSFVISGSEDSQVYIWHRRQGTLLHTLPGHSATVNSVAWNPADPSMFVSASDDHTIRVWGAPQDAPAPAPPAQPTD